MRLCQARLAIDVGALHTRVAPGFVTDLLPDAAAPAVAGMIDQGLAAIRAHFERA